MVGGRGGSRRRRGTIGALSPNIQNQRKVLLKLYRYLDSSFEAESASQKYHHVTQTKQIFPSFWSIQACCRKDGFTFFFQNQLLIFAKFLCDLYSEEEDFVWSFLSRQSEAHLFLLWEPRYSKHSLQMLQRKLPLSAVFREVLYTTYLGSRRRYNVRSIT